MSEYILVTPTKWAIRNFSSHFTRDKKYRATKTDINSYVYQTDGKVSMFVNNGCINNKYVKLVILSNLIGGKLL